MRSLLWYILLACRAVPARGYLTLGTDSKEADPDFRELKKYALLSAIAYCATVSLPTGPFSGPDARPPASLRDIVVMDVFNFDNFLEIGAGYVALDHQFERIYLAFKGTSSSADWINNLDFVSIAYTPEVVKNGAYNVSGRCCTKCRVHRGFMSFMHKSGPAVLDKVVALKDMYPGYQIQVTGHSLGAALALITAIELRLLGYDVLVVTLGSPKVGNHEFVRFVDQMFDTPSAEEHIAKHRSFQWLSNGYVRMVHRHDLIPFLPPFKKYAHAGYEYYLSMGGVTQAPDTIYRRGKSYIEDGKFDYLNTMLKFRRIEHSNYFLPLSACRHAKA
ncbi:alpha/beta-hydrolase [Metschnikowia bicuspidata]|uniref:triacylglycerol lipase n=1 Tax=Metschnikowia bicuspidata TaxID=27322 RepID=A0A4P9ZA48_9ASCO|nr:alpha/beta-hydrolase [Metschnikowia bicuspidata]